MKSKSIFLSLLLVGFAVINTRAQGVHLGVKGGANIFKVDGQGYDQGFHFGYNVGAFAELNFTSSWGIQPELLWNQTNYRTGTQFSSIYPGGLNDVKGKLNYLSVPLLLSYRPVKLLSLQAGPQFGILLSQDKNLADNTKDAFKKGDFSLVGGVQLNLANLVVGGRYVVGLTDINDVTDNQKWKNQGFQVYAGFRFF
ncbi:porin family protein [Flavitalea sp. BT771]|uniref:porin family protein n=1 Tax=Flavitalea sp. BT771 TaxID=3063329 RepID=UPI0026E29C3B|nr:porin family protein [Flavitalea sp. BT771]MDO6431330.1 porin family protein [Flavitalea sp. BT771]MDV6220238.1 porin family protein [Flavitalea sp. BT771]